MQHRRAGESPYALWPVKLSPDRSAINRARSGESIAGGAMRSSRSAGGISLLIGPLHRHGRCGGPFTQRLAPFGLRETSLSAAGHSGVVLLVHVELSLGRSGITRPAEYSPRAPHQRLVGDGTDPLTWRRRGPRVQPPILAISPSGRRGDPCGGGGDGSHRIRTRSTLPRQRRRS